MEAKRFTVSFLATGQTNPFEGTMEEVLEDMMSFPESQNPQNHGVDSHVSFVHITTVL